MGRAAGSEGLFAGLFARGGVAAGVTERAFLQAMLDVEVALLRALGRAGVAAASAGDELAAVANADSFDLEGLGRAAGEQGTPVPALLAALRSRVSEPTAAHIHEGATSQDVVDTATMLVARRVLGPLIEDLGGAADACAALAERHRGSVEAGRTLLQQAAPITFGLKAAGWLGALDSANAELLDVREHVLAAQLGGAVGTLARLGAQGLAVLADVAEQLELVVPNLPWHAVRLRPARLACALGAALGVMGKVARDVTLLAQTEVGEVSEGAAAGRGGSSTLPHKRNPVGAVAVLACAQRSPGLVATILSGMSQEHERAAGAWQAEGETLLELLQLAGSAAASLRAVLEGLQVDPERMSANIAALTMSESVASALSRKIDRQRAQELVTEAAKRTQGEGRLFRAVLLELPEVVELLGSAGVDDALSPERYLGVTEKLIDRALAAHRDHVNPRSVPDERSRNWNEDSP